MTTTNPSPSGTVIGGWCLGVVARSGRRTSPDAGSAAVTLAIRPSILIMSSRGTCDGLCRSPSTQVHSSYVDIRSNLLAGRTILHESVLGSLSNTKEPMLSCGGGPEEDDAAPVDTVPTLRSR